MTFVFLLVHQTPVSPPEVPPEPETPNPFNQLTDKELEEYRKEVERKRDGGTNGMLHSHFIKCFFGRYMTLYYVFNDLMHRHMLQK